MKIKIFQSFDFIFKLSISISNSRWLPELKDILSYLKDKEINKQQLRREVQSPTGNYLVIYYYLLMT